jgi:hypothetical protein
MISGLLYVFGGSDGMHSLCTSEIFDPRMNLWTAGPNMTTRRVNVSGAFVAGKIWAVGGFSGNSLSLRPVVPMCNTVRLPTQGSLS